MAVPLTGTGSLAARLGPLFAWGLDQLALLGAPATARVLTGASGQARVGAIESAYNAGNASQATIDNSLQGITGKYNAWSQAQAALFTSLIQPLAKQTVIDMMNLDVPQPDAQLSTALAALIAQMTLAGTSFNASVPGSGALAAQGTPAGNPVAVVSLLGPLDAKAFQYVQAETLSLACTADSVTGSQPAGQEQYRVRGQLAAGSNYAYNWPLGSAATLSPAAVAPGTNSSPLNQLLYDSDFTSFVGSPNLPDQWAAATGAVGTQILNGTATAAYSAGGGSVELVGDSATLTAITQQFNTALSSTAGAGGSPSKLTASTVLHFNGFFKLSAGSPAAGVLAVSLVDGSGTVVNDNAGNPNTASVALTGIADTAWHALSGAFRLPASPPATLKLRAKLTTALTTGTNLFLSRLTLVQPGQLYVGGPWISLHSGSAAALLGDSYTLGITQTWGVWQREFERYFGMKSLKLQFPAATSSPTVADSLVA